MNKVTMIPRHVTYNGDIRNPGLVIHFKRSEESTNYYEAHIKLDLWFVKALGREMKNFVLRWWENNVSDLEDLRKSYKV